MFYVNSDGFIFNGCLLLTLNFQREATNSSEFKIIMFNCCVHFHFRLSSSKQSRVYLPEAPFPHAEVNIFTMYFRHPTSIIFTDFSFVPDFHLYYGEMMIAIPVLY